MSKETLGHIDCPTCGTAKGIRITHDKNGEPFGYCEAKCNQQMRIGGSAYRVGLFVERNPWAAAKPVSAPVPAAPVAAAPAPAPVPAKPAARKPAANPFDYLLKGTGA